MSAWFTRWLPLALLTLAALVLRVRDLDARPMHADEANQAVKAGELLAGGRYAFDPRDHHGPVLYYATLPVAWARGQHGLADLDETTVRLVPALIGTLAVLLTGLLAAPFGRAPALAAAVFVAVSPPAVYFSRYFIQETLLATFTLATFLAARQAWRTGKYRWAIAAGLGLGLMQATKASAPLFVFAGLAAWLVVRPREQAGSLRRPVVATALSLLAAGLTAAAFYSSFGAHPAGLVDALGTYGAQAARLESGTTGHEKPWWYYVQLFVGQRRGGLIFEQATFLALAAAGAVVALAGRSTLARWSAVYAALLLAGLSFPAYKTPWHAIHLVAPFALLCAAALADLMRFRLGGVLVAATTALVVAFLAFQTDRVTRVYPADPRNPYAYVHSSPDVAKFRALAEAGLRAAPNQPVRVISEEYWPLPWYFRGLPAVGYWNQVPDDCDGALVVASAGLADAVRARLHGDYAETYLGLRPGFVCVAFTRRP